MLLLLQPGVLDKLSNCTVVGAQPEVGLTVKSATTSGLTHIVMVSEVIPHPFKPDVKSDME